MVANVMDIHLCSVVLHVCSVSMHSILSTFAFWKVYAAERCGFDWTSVHPVWYFIQQAVTRNIRNSRYILMTMFAWGQVFPRTISLKRIYQTVPKSAFRAIQTLFHCGFLCQKKAQGPNDRHSKEKGKQRGKLGWATSASFLPLLFSQWLVLCDIFVWVHQVHKYAGWLAGQGGKASVTCCPVVGKAPWQPWRNALVFLHNDCPGHSYPLSTSE